MRYPNEEQYAAAALVGLCTHSAAKAHYDLAELGSRAAAIGHATAKAMAEQQAAEEPQAEPAAPRGDEEPKASPPAEEPPAEPKAPKKKG